jgi:bifunctional non-homologous end joining protein LigD
MEPVQVDEAFDSDAFLFQIKWDGVRCLAYSGNNGELRLINRHLNERTTQYPELVRSLSLMPENTVFDGEIVVLGEDGKPSFPRILQRDLVRSPSTVQKVMRSHPALYMVFDLLWLKGENLTNRPLVERIEKLGNLLDNKAPIIYVESVFNHGIALSEASRNEGLEGIVAKDKNSPYLIDKKVPLWKKIKNWRSIRVKVGGYLLDETGRLRSLVIGLQEEDGLRHVGSVSSGLTQENIKILKQYFDSKPEVPCPLKSAPAKYSDTVRWVPPEIGLTVRFLEWGSDGKLRNPTLISFSDYMEV